MLIVRAYIENATPLGLALTHAGPELFVQVLLRTGECLPLCPPMLENLIGSSGRDSGESARLHVIECVLCPGRAR